jgi:hypothetical protein
VSIITLLISIYIFRSYIAFIHRSTVLEQQSHDIDVPILRGVVQCCLLHES